MWSVGFFSLFLYFKNTHTFCTHLTQSKQRQCFIFHPFLQTRNQMKKERNAHTEIVDYGPWFIEKFHDRNQHNSPFYRDFSHFVLALIWFLFASSFFWFPAGILFIFFSAFNFRWTNKDTWNKEEQRNRKIMNEECERQVGKTDKRSEDFGSVAIKRITNK